MSDSTPLSPQERALCCCPAWSTAHQCIARRYASVEDDEECECVCHQLDLEGEDDE